MFNVFFELKWLTFLHLLGHIIIINNLNVIIKTK